MSTTSEKLPDWAPDRSPFWKRNPGRYMAKLTEEELHADLTLTLKVRRDTATLVTADLVKLCCLADPRVCALRGLDC